MFPNAIEGTPLSNRDAVHAPLQITVFHPAFDAFRS